MRIYSNCREAVKEVERDLWELGITQRTTSMQDKVIQNDEDYYTKEMTAYSFQITDPFPDSEEFIKYLFPDDWERILSWCKNELLERVADYPVNPGQAYKIRADIWDEYLHAGKFAYTYNKRIRPQLKRIIQELEKHSGTRQAILEIHNNEWD